MIRVSVRPHGQAAKDRAETRIGAARARYERSWVKDVVAQMGALDFAEWTMIFGAELLWSAVPFLILLGSLANHRIDDDLSRHIGLNREAAQIVRQLFRSSPSHDVVAIVSGLLFAFAGIIAVVASLQVIYERVFDQERRAWWRNFPRYVVWFAGLLGALIVEAVTQSPERDALGPVVQALFTFAEAAIFFAWTIHFLLAGRVPWRSVMRPALVTALLWLVLAFVSSLLFSSEIIDDSKTYGTIGVVFTLLTWFVLVGTAIMFGAAIGGVWQQRVKTSR